MSLKELQATVAGSAVASGSAGDDDGGVDLMSSFKNFLTTNHSFDFAAKNRNVKKYVSHFFRLYLKNLII
jgi:hypothetical protein